MSAPTEVSDFDPSRDRVAVVSGAGTGIGQATAVAMARRGWRVAVGGRRVDRLAETTALVEAAGGKCLAHPLDVTDGGSVAGFFDAVENAFGPATVVVNNAAVARYGPLDDFSPAEVEAEIATKLTGALLMTIRGVQAMRAAGTRGDVLFVTSLAAVQPWPHHLPYAAANAGVEQAARSLRLELEGTGIRVTMLRCGQTLGTDFATREQGQARRDRASRTWFADGLLRHTGLMEPGMVADSIVAAVTLPVGYQYETLAVVPTAPIGPRPATYEDFGAEMVRRHFAGGAPEPSTTGEPGS